LPHIGHPRLAVALNMIYVRSHRSALDDEPAVSGLLYAFLFFAAVSSLLASDQETAICWRIFGATGTEVHAIRLRFDEIAARNAEIEVSLDMLCLLVCAVTGACGCDAESRVGIKLRLRLNAPHATMAP